MWKVADFGITGQGTGATNLDSHFSTGTAAYYAPELVGGCNNVDICAKDAWEEFLGPGETCYKHIDRHEQPCHAIQGKWNEGGLHQADPLLSEVSLELLDEGVKDADLIDGYGPMTTMITTANEGSRVSMKVHFLHFSWLTIRNKDWKQRVEHGPPTFVNISLLALKHLVL